MRSMVLMVLVLFLRGYSQDATPTPQYNDSFTGKRWVLVFEKHQFGLFNFSWDTFQQDYVFEKHIKDLMYKTPIKRFLPASRINTNLFIGDLYQSGFTVYFAERKGICFVQHKDPMEGARIRRELKGLPFTKVWDDVENVFGELDPKKFEYGAYPKKKIEKNAVLPYDPSVSLATTAVDSATLKKLFKEINRMSDRMNKLEKDIKTQSLLQYHQIGDESLIDQNQKVTTLKEYGGIENKDSQNFDTAAAPINNVGKSPLENLGETSETSDLSREEMYRLAFGIEGPEIPDKYQCELIINGKKRGTIWYYHKEKKVSSEGLLPILEKQFVKDSLDHLTNIIVDGKISIDDLKGKKILVQAQFEGGMCYMQFPFEWFKEEFESRSVHSSATAYSASAFSGYINTRGRQRFKMYDYKKPCGALCRDELILQSTMIENPLSLNFDGMVNLFSFVTEVNATYYEGDTDPFRITTVRLVKDLRNWAVRLTLGDLSSSGGGGGGALFGFGAEKVRRITSTNNAKKLNDVEFELKNASEIRVYVNKKLLTVTNLSSGVHSITDFDNISEENEIQLEIIDFAGTKEFLNFSFLEEAELVSTGEILWGGSVGFRRERSWKKFANNFSPWTESTIINSDTLESEHSPHSDSLIFQGKYRQGFTKWLKGDVNGLVSLEGDHNLSASLYLLHGGFTYNVVLGEQSDMGILGWYTEAGVSGTFDRIDTEKDAAISWRLRTKYRDHYFGDRHTKEALFGPTFLQLSGGVHAALPQATTIGLQLGYYINEDSTGRLDREFNETILTATLGKSWGNGFSAGLNINYKSDMVDGSDLTLGVDARYNFKVGRHSVRVSNKLAQRKQPFAPKYNSQGDVINEFEAPTKEWKNTGQATWGYSEMGRGGLYHGLGADATMTDDYTDVGVQGSGGSNWGDLRFGYRIVDQNGENINVIQREASIDVATGIAWAGTSIAITKPVYGSFALVRNNKNMTFKSTRINPMGERDEEAVAYPLFPAVITNIGNYQQRNLSLEPNLPFGSEPIQTQFAIESGYKTGFEFVVGSQNGVVLLGTLKQESGTPFSRRVFRIFELDENKEIIEEKVQTSFTNQVGRFQATCIAGRSYKVEIRVDGYIFGGVFTVPEGESDLYEAGDFWVVQSSGSDQKDYEKAFDALQKKNKVEE
ncbi:MAG: hypothetical protein OCC49_15270 [Fibrobacterales bacterium]